MGGRERGILTVRRRRRPSARQMLEYGRSSADTMKGRRVGGFGVGGGFALHFSATQPARAPDLEGTPLSVIANEVWSKADLHIHSNHTDGPGKIPEIMEYVANKTDLKVIAITDHNTLEGALFAKYLSDLYGIEVVVAEEVSSKEGHILGLFLTEEIPPGMSAADTIGINEQDGVAIIPHPFRAQGVFGPRP